MPTVYDRLVGPLRERFDAVDYRHDPVVALLGEDAVRALGRNETVPAERVVDGSSDPLATLIRLWLLERPVEAEALTRALPGLVDLLEEAGVVTRSGDAFVATLDLRPYATEDADLWLASDLTPGLDGAAARLRTDHVLGVSPASTSLAQLTPRAPVGRSLDLGTGCGVQALHLLGHSDAVVATDVNPRALQLTGFNAELNELATKLDIRQGSLLDPVEGERFDLVVSNPPFVIGPAEPLGGRLTYRDSGLAGDRVVADLVTGLPAHLELGGTAHLVANWLHVAGQPWEERVASWVRDCDAWVVQREILDPAAYVELWLKDSGHHPSTGGATPETYRRHYRHWLEWMESVGATGVGFGWICLRRTDAETSLRVEEWPYEVVQPIAPEVTAHFARVDARRERDGTALLAARLRVREDVRQETVGPPGAPDPATIVLRQQDGLRRAVQVDSATAAWVGACDGELPLGRILDAVADLLDAPAETIREDATARAEDLLAEGFLLPE